MPYDVTIITVKPNAHLQALPFVEQRAEGEAAQGRVPRLSLYAEIGEINRILLLHHYASEADLAADRSALVAEPTRSGWSIW